jgi:hypothetical protein
MSMRATGPIVLVVAMLAGACSGGGDSRTGPLPTAPESARVDLVVPDFPNPTEITNPLFPMSGLTQVIQLGTEADEPMRVEFTLLPGTRTIDWDGRQVENRIGQFVGFRGGRILEAARDYFAQAADGSVWYFGEEVDNYSDGVVAEHEGNWLAGRDGPPGMIMPAKPVAGVVYRPENVPGVVLEESTVKAVDQTVDGPRGPVPGAVLVQELLMDGTTEDKTFAPGYGEFRASAEDEQVAVAVAAPTDAVSTPMPEQLSALYAGSVLVFDAVPANDWDRISTAADSMTAAWAALVTTGPPPLLVAEMNRVLAGLVAAAPGRKARAVSSAALDVALATLDLQMQYRPVADLDADRPQLWARRIRVDAGEEDVAGIRSDVAALGRVWDRVRPSVGPPEAAEVDGHLAQLGDLAAKKDVGGALRTSQALLGTLQR